MTHVLHLAEPGFRARPPSRRVPLCTAGPHLLLGTAWQLFLAPMWQVLLTSSSCLPVPCPQVIPATGNMTHWVLTDICTPSIPVAKRRETQGLFSFFPECLKN